jgi:hypothetical protein
MALSASVLPAGNVCIHRFARTFDGLIEGSGPVRYKCQQTVTERMTASATLRITAKAECDDVGTLMPATGLGLRAKGTTIRRADGFAHFAGRAEIIHATPEPDVVLFTGDLELIARIGSHPALGELCAPEQHVEGWFVGRGLEKFAKMTLRVILVGNGDLAAGTNAFPDAGKNRMIGTLVIAP